MTFGVVCGGGACCYQQRQNECFNRQIAITTHRFPFQNKTIRAPSNSHLLRYCCCLVVEHCRNLHHPVEHHPEEVCGRVAAMTALGHILHVWCGGMGIRSTRFIVEQMHYLHCHTFLLQEASAAHHRDCSLVELHTDYLQREGTQKQIVHHNHRPVAEEHILRLAARRTGFGWDTTSLPYVRGSKDNTRW